MLQLLSVPDDTAANGSSSWIVGSKRGRSGGDAELFSTATYCCRTTKSSRNDLSNCGARKQARATMGAEASLGPPTPALLTAVTRTSYDSPSAKSNTRALIVASGNSTDHLYYKSSIIYHTIENNLPSWIPELVFFFSKI